ncbi:peptidase [Acrocarpospora pleiomorpha]|uniref:Peptidase n=1 Tax=Acrocarpospora pleiomorpha TaxID=90975 RepID=A0A5M3XLC5_9ACTN|nr:alpha/beta hydrolase [Acrocarpospora pleiomorpha]GES20451.1 peptidase [Acrocarpospora pleiomorpha]
MTREDIEFDSCGETIRGWFYPASGAEGPAPTVILAGGWCYVRELVMPYYAERFAAAGINALVFDYRNLGVSDGGNRQHLDPWAQIRDYQSALSYVETRADVDNDRLGVWGISYSGGHVLILAAIDPRIKVIVSQIPVIDGYRNMRRVHGTVGFRKLLSLVEEDRRLRAGSSGKQLYLAHASAVPHEEISAWPFPETYETFAALKASEAPGYENRSTVESVALLMEYHVGPFLGRLLQTPVLMIAAEGDDLTLWDLEIDAFNEIPSPAKRLEILPHTTHMTLYSDRGKLEVAAGHATEWFVTQLAAGK